VSISLKEREREREKKKEKIEKKRTNCGERRKKKHSPDSALFPLCSYPINIFYPVLASHTIQLCMYFTRLYSSFFFFLPFFKKEEE
jgi:hypothetical protein